jgi:DNA-binding GntR family transcriptional regulator
MAAVTLKEQAYIKLKEMIVRGELKAGDFLTERTLVDMLGMSRTPIRSALERLDGDGLANYTPNKGLIVAEMSLRKAIDLYDFRIALETYVVRRLADQYLEERDEQWLRDNLLEQERYMLQEDNAAFTIADAAFHRKLVQLHGNSEMESTMSQLQDKLHLTANAVLRKERSRIGVSYEDHCRILQYVKEGNGNAAAEAMERHLEYGKRILIM